MKILYFTSPVITDPSAALVGILFFVVITQIFVVLKFWPNLCFLRFASLFILSGGERGGGMCHWEPSPHFCIPGFRFVA